MKCFFSDSETAKIVKTIREAESRTSGEIRVHLERRCWRSATARAAAVFNKLGMYKTDDHTGVLIYIALKSRKVAIIGDSGINQHVHLEFWRESCGQLQKSFQKEAYCEGICATIRTIGEELKHHFPAQENDSNELSDSISYG
ncbi:MAG: TPM domain-containing protein [Calditrichota bacterium]